MSPGTTPADWRATAWKALEDGVFDLLVIGGGVTGSGIARDAAGRGLSVALIDTGDFGGATSGSSSRLAHGGLRYLESFEFGLVFESLRERRLLLKLAPHLVRPLSFLFPVFRGDDPGLPKLAAGMLLYEGLSLFRSPGHQRMLTRAGALEVEPGIRPERLVGGAVYHDAQVDDARLTVAVARGAREAGAIVMNYASAVSIARSDGDGHTAVRVRDMIDGGEVAIKARLVVNAAGPWSDDVRRLADPSADRRLRTTKGAHVLMRRDRVGNRNAIIFRSVVDGRVMFILPWGDFTYVGTTDTEFDGNPADAAADAGDIRYLLDSANAIFPGARLTESDIVSTWAGVRPLLAPRGSANLSASATSREHTIWRDPSGLLNIAGGKLTTFRSMAAEVATVAAEILRSEFGVPSGSFHSEFLPLPGAPELGMDHLVRSLESEARSFDMPETVLRGLASRHGTDTKEILDIIAADRGTAARMRPDLDYVMAEVVHAARTEMAVTLEDVMRRRLHPFYDAPDGGLSVAGEVARILARELGWSEAETADQLGRYTQSVRRSRPG